MQTWDKKQAEMAEAGEEVAAQACFQECCASVEHLGAQVTGFSLQNLVRNCPNCSKKVWGSSSYTPWNMLMFSSWGANLGSIVLGNSLGHHSLARCVLRLLHFCMPESQPVHFSSFSKAFLDVE